MTHSFSKNTNLWRNYDGGGSLIKSTVWYVVALFIRAMLQMVRFNKYGIEKSEKRLESKQIKESFDTGKFELIPSRFRGMKRLWENNPATSGLVTRREKEAVFFEEALKCNCWK